MAWAAAAPAVIGAMGTIGGALASRGGKPGVDYGWSNQQEATWNQAYPFMTGITQYGMANMGQPYMGAPMMGAPPSLYNVPRSDGLMPTQGWYDNLSSEVKQGLWEPWNDAANQLQMNMGVQGQLGSPRAGYSGAAGTGLGQLYADAGQQVGMQAWQMTQPGQQAMWQANLGRNIAGYEADMNQYQNNYQRQVEAWQYPFGILPGAASGSYPTGVITQNGNPWAGAMGGAATGLMAYNMFGGNNQGTSAPYTPFQTGNANYTGRPVDQWQYSGGAY